MGNEQKVYDVLQELNIDYIKHEHPPVFTVEEANRYYQGIPGVKCKNLFLRDRKGKQHFLVVAEDSKQVNLKALSELINSEPLSFASPERLMKYLGLVSGEVSPFGLINDMEKQVHVVLDEDFKKADEINFHPNTNTATITLAYNDFLRYLNWCGNPMQYAKIG